MLVVSIARYPKTEIRIGANGDRIVVRYLGRDSQGRARTGLEGPPHITFDRDTVDEDKKLNGLRRRTR